jgi:regulator of protease activity HflC (stomatin/prohibitin superfamily)
MENREGFSQQVHQSLIENLDMVGSPIAISQFGFARLNPPDQIVESYRQAEQRKIDLQKAEADKLVKIKEAEARLEIAKKEAKVRLAKAQAFVEEAETYAKVVTPEWLALRRLEVAEKVAESDNVIFYPLDMATDKAVEMETMRNLRSNAGAGR